jgi:hypothetical protein
MEVPPRSDMAFQVANALFSSLMEPFPPPLVRRFPPASSSGEAASFRQICANQVESA